MDHRHAESERDLLKRIRHRRADVRRVLRLALDDHAERDDRVDVLFSRELLDQQRDLKRTRNREVQHLEIRRNLAQFFLRVVDQAADELAVVVARHERKGAPLAHLARTGWQDVRHCGPAG